MRNRAKPYFLVGCIVLLFTTCRRDNELYQDSSATCVVNDLHNNTLKVTSDFDKFIPHLGIFEDQFKSDSLIYFSCMDTFFMRFRSPYALNNPNGDTLNLGFRDSCKVGDVIKIEFKSGENHMWGNCVRNGMEFQLHPNVFVTKVIKQ